MYAVAAGAAPAPARVDDAGQAGPAPRPAATAVPVRSRVSAPVGGRPQGLELTAYLTAVGFGFVRNVLVYLRLSRRPSTTRGCSHRDLHHCI